MLSKTTTASVPGGLLGVYRPDLRDALDRAGVPAYRYDQVYEHLVRRPLQPFAQASALPPDIRRVLDALEASYLAPVESRTASDGTIKLLLRARDGALLEAVMMPYQRRVTLCISSQAGCPVGCVFCATGALGFRRNLCAAEIVDQARAVSALALDEGRRISNIVYMGMGEPLLNLQPVLDSIRVFTDPKGMALAHRALSVSTVGIPGGIIRLANAEPQVNLALSLHAADDGTRARLIPRKHLHPLAEILTAAWQHFSITRRKLLVEYVLLRGVNDSVEDAKKLAGLLRGHVVAVNLLVWNPVAGLAPGNLLDAPAGKPRREGPHSSPADRGARVAGGLAARDLGPRRGTDAGVAESRFSRFQPSPPAAVAAFRETLLASHIETVVRRSKGADIQAACGQLAAQSVSAAVPREE
jgi:23S rRNA (adenine2503-C2)-methyltransferase